ncbi:hypothetical protein CVT25_000728 [Psilocybe cyanescens]|uniref:Uncharacterized protein n=1 Tax=Psilocybe cyanescens TaxID=93625 RepID=A0A409X3L4_PSICY|nr:hypothetical protein CVT25_000728 [Psilocybe cyanescens]
MLRMQCFNFSGTSFLGAFSLLVLVSPRAAAATVLGTINKSGCTSRGAGASAFHNYSSACANDADAFEEDAERLIAEGEAVISLVRGMPAVVVACGVDVVADGWGSSEFLFLLKVVDRKNRNSIHPYKSTQLQCQHQNRYVEPHTRTLAMHSSNCFQEYLPSVPLTDTRLQTDAESLAAQAASFLLVGGLVTKEICEDVAERELGREQKKKT